ncbi:ATP phosphoribosyltransferase [uncultured Draconibacterium sp.]|uniref:ATP phosphoribosyltransferase n=1 Tax=uncultured Draconibacterium sp. TaxID=1573823 RepID=UPI0032163419
MENKIKIAIQTKGRLNEDSMNLINEAGIGLKMGRRTLVSEAKNFPMDALFLRDDDIPQTVADGVADIGVVGENEMAEKDENVVIAKRLGFSKCRLSLAIPKSIEYSGIKFFEGKKIATSYPVILKKFLDEKNIKAEIHVISGSVEIAPGIGLADAIFDIVSSGSTLVSNRLKEVEVVMQSEAVLIANPKLSAEKKEILTN